jgi:uncharacterized membrane protein YhaH (DUF805 family)
VALFSLSGRITRLPYLLISIILFFSQHLFALLLMRAHEIRLDIGVEFFVLPARTLFSHSALSSGEIILTLCIVLLVTWCLVVLSFHRAKDADATPWLAISVISPIVQLFSIGVLSALPSRESASASPKDDAATHLGWPNYLSGAIIGAVLLLTAVGSGAFVFGAYGYGIFVVTPFLIGIITGIAANLKQDSGAKKTRRILFLTLALGALALIAFAFEGLVCLIMAAPIAIPVALLGAAIGRDVAVTRAKPRRDAAASMSLLPLVFVLEIFLPAEIAFDTHQEIDIAATPESVWQTLVAMDLSDYPVPPLFHLGLAYPIRGEIDGAHVGGIRYGEFSTGIAIEEITIWEENRELAFRVLDNPPSMRELSPYASVHAPHVEGYLETLGTSFEIIPLEGGGARLIERTAHVMRLDPAAYWLPIARWVIGANNSRVLSYIRESAEARSRLVSG